MSSSLFEQRTKVYNQKFETKSAYFDFKKSPNASKPSPNYVPSDFMSQAQSDIVNIEWTVSNGLGTVVLGQGTDEIEVNWLQGGAGQVCVLVENECGPTENCFDIVVTDMPAPNAGSDDIICGLSCSLTGSGGAGNATWSLVSGPGGIVFSDANSFNTDVSVDVSGTYLFALELDNTGCISTDAV